MAVLASNDGAASLRSNLIVTLKYIAPGRRMGRAG